MRRLLTGFLAFAAVFSAATASRAHIDLLTPESRYPGDGMSKAGPCGVAGDSRNENLVTVYEPGATITVSWKETIDHPGHYRIMFAQDGFAFPTPSEDVFCTEGQETAAGNGMWCLKDNITDKVSNDADNDYSATVTLPNVSCDNCTLQLIQWMNGATAGNEVYHKCADLVLSAGGTGGGGGSSTTTGSGGGGTTTSTGSGVGGSGGDGEGGSFNAYPDDSKGCSMGSGEGSAGVAAAAALGLLAFFGRRRRSAR